MKWYFCEEHGLIGIVDMGRLDKIEEHRIKMLCMANFTIRELNP